MTTKTCNSCSTEKSTSEFGKNKSKKDGLQTWCKECVAGYNKTYYKNTPERNTQRLAWKEKNLPIAQDYVWNTLINNPCVDCGETDPVVLEFDHVSDDKEFNIGRYFHGGCNLDKLKLEIAKCEVRCANCHRRITAKRGNSWRYQRNGLVVQ